MKSFKQFLDEARRNPELNPKISIYRALEPYKDRDDMHITYIADVGKDFSKKSFRDKDKRPRGKGISSLDRNISGFKVGINPQSTFNTPNGIYVYPLKQAWKLYANKTTQKIDVPYAGDEPTVALLQQTPGANVVEVSKISSKDYDRDFMKLAKMIIDVRKRNGGSEAWAWEYAKGILNRAQLDAKDKSPGGIWWNMTRYTFFVLYSERKKQGSFFANDVPPPEYKEEVYAMIKDPKMKANFGDMTNRLYNIILAGRTNTKSSNIWSQVFRDLGVDGATDRLGKRIIHPSEPMQGVFFNPRAYKVVGSFYNKGYQEDSSGNGIVLVNKTVDGTPSGIMVGAKISQPDLISGVYAISGANRAKYVLFRAAVVRFLTKVYGGATLTINPATSDFNKVQDAILSGNTSKFPFRISIQTNNNEVIVLTDEWFSFEVPEKSEYFILDYTELADQEKRDELNDWIMGQV